MAKMSKPVRQQSSHKRYLMMATLTLIGVAALQLGLAASYLAAFHAPKPHQLHIAVVGGLAQTQPVAAAITSASKGAYQADVVTSDTEAISQLKKQTVYAVYIPAFPTSKIIIASANGESISQAVAASLVTADGTYQQQTRQFLATTPATAKLATTAVRAPLQSDIAALPAGDNKGLALFYVAFSAVFGGYLVAVALNLVRGERAFTRYNAMVRIGGFAIFSIVTSLFVALIATHGVQAMPAHHYWGIAAIVALTTFGVSLVASSLISLFGIVGTALVIILFVILGTPASGGTIPLNLTGGGPWQWLAPYLPTGASVGALRQTIYFDGVDMMRHLLVPVVYVIIGIAALLGIGSPKSSISAYEHEIADDVDELAKL